MAIMVGVQLWNVFLNRQLLVVGQDSLCTHTVFLPNIHAPSPEKMP